jgi:hypothetical protein
MEGNFLSRYENKLSEWEKLMESDPDNRDKHEDEMNEYILMCIPFIEKYMDKNQKQQEVTNVFNCKINKGLQKKEIFENYLDKVEGQYIQKDFEINIYTCKNCKSFDMFIDPLTSDSICRGCGIATQTLTHEMSYKEEQETSEKIMSYSYKRENHFNEWISQFQAQETTSIPVEVIDQLRTELKKIKIKKLSDITHAKVRGLLKKLRLNKYYEHVPYISNILNGMQPPKMTQILEERLRLMFKEIQEPFDKNCPQDRKNFLSYSYVLYKFCELLGEDQYLQCFPLLKSKEKLYQQDVIWKLICVELKWEFIPTI